MITTIPATLKMKYDLEMDVDLEFNGLWLEAVVLGPGQRLTETIVVGHKEPLDVAIWAAAVGWGDANSRLIEEAEYEQAVARVENEFERKRSIAA